MNQKTISRIIRETAYIRTGGSAEEKKTAQYLTDECAKLGLNATLEAFSVDMATIHTATLEVDGKLIPCKGYLTAGSHEVEAPLYYLTDNCPYSLANCKGKIVLFDGYLGYWRYQDLLENGAVGFITYDGNLNYADRDIDQRELRSYVSKGNFLPGVNINAKDAVKLVKQGAKTAKIVLEQEHYTADSHNVILTCPVKTASISSSPPTTIPLPFPRAVMTICPAPSAFCIWQKPSPKFLTTTVCALFGAAAKNGVCWAPRPTAPLTKQNLKMWC